MKMFPLITLSNFEETLSPKQVAKGNKYYTDNAINSLTETEPNTWEAEVLGTEMYEVMVQLKKSGAIVATNCDCPHEDEICKHVIAVLFALQDELSINKTTKQKKLNNKPAIKKIVGIDNLLQEIKEEDLKKFVKEAAKKNKDFRNLFMLRFQYANQADSYEKYAAMIRDCAKVYIRRGFIDYESGKALKAAEDIATEAELALGKGDYRITFDAGCAIIKEVHAMFDHMDDSNGRAGDCVEKAFSCLFEMAQNIDVPIMLRNEIFEYAFAECDKPHYKDFGFDSQMLGLTINSATDNDQYTLTLNKIEGQLKNTDSSYRQKELLDAKIILLNKMERHNEANQIVEDNMHHWQYREAMIQKCIDAKNYEQAKRYAEDEFKNEERKGWQGNIRRWKEWLLTIAIKEKDIASIRKYSRQFYFDLFEHRFYEIYKKTFNPKEWITECNEWIKWFISKGAITIPQLYALANIYIAERSFDRLLVLLQKNPFYEFAEVCKPLLQKIYPEEMLKIFRKSLLDYAHDNAGRNNYVTLRKRLTEMQKIIDGKVLVEELVTYFLRSYKNRPAMIDELSKIKL